MDGCIQRAAVRNPALPMLEPGVFEDLAAFR